MMKRLMTGIFILMSVTNAQAVHLSNDGIGEVLIFPYYTVNGGFNTLINVTNTTDQAKALRVRFREAANAREVFTFNLYLGPQDVWAGGLIKGDGQQTLTYLISQDLSCTVPSVNSGLMPFNQDNYVGEMADSYGADVNRMHEGFIEVIEMGVLTGDSALATEIGKGATDLNCLTLQNAWSSETDNNYWFNDPQVDLLPPSGGVTGHVVLVDVAEGTSISEKPTMLNDFSDEVLHFNVNGDLPTLANAKTTAVFDAFSQTHNLEFSKGYEAVSSVLMASDIAGEYALDTEINAKTDWIVTMPTKQFHVDSLYSESLPVPVAPFTTFVDLTETACEAYGVAGLYDRESETPTAGSQPPPPGTSPPFVEPAIPAFCFATNDINFSNGTNNSPLGIFDSNFPSSTNSTDTFETPYRNGWVKLIFGQSTHSNNDYYISGLPIVGFGVQQYTNTNAQPGLLAQYMGSFDLIKEPIIARNEDNQDSSLSGMSISPSNTGQVLLFPYYTVRNDLNSLISVVNTSDEVKAVKIRFNEALNNREVLDFNLYLSPFDVWTAGLVLSESTLPGYEGQTTAKIVTNDNSCTVPVINNQEFLPYAFTGDFNDGLIQDLSRAVEGSLEIFEMGSVIGDDATAATHIVGQPQDCLQLINNWTAPTGQWIIDSSFNIVDPDGSGGLFASMSIIDVANGIDMTYDAKAIIGYSFDESHSFPGDLLPNLASGDNVTTLIEAQQDFFQTTWDSPLEAVTALFMQTQIVNDYALDELINAETEWVNYFPTKSFFTDPLFSQEPVPAGPFRQALNEFGACDIHRFSSYNREQQINPTQGAAIDPPPPNFSIFPQTCWSVNVMDINKGDNTSTIFDSQLAITDFRQDPNNASSSHLTYENGWMQMDFDNNAFNSGRLTGTGPNGETHTIYGLPVSGFVAQKYVNSNAQPGLLANYGVINMNKYKKEITVTESVNER